MIKKMFALASVTALVGLVSSMGAAGCSSSSGGDDGDAAVDASLPDVRRPKEGGDEDAAGPPEEGTVGKECKADTDCNVAGSKNDNICTQGATADGDLYGSPVCIQLACKQGKNGTFADLFCDDGAGLCTVASGSTSGVCLPACGFDSASVTSKCNGGNKCLFEYYGTTSAMKVVGVGYCEAACVTDGDCKGTGGQKCQTETGYCKNPDKIEKYAKMPGEGCNGAAATDECFCIRVGGAGASKDKGVCTKSCITGAAGNAICGAAGDGGATGDGGTGDTTGWTCTAQMPLKDDKGAAAFTGQPDDLKGVCAKPCQDVDGDVACADLATATGTPMKCKEFAGGKWCDPAE